MSNEKKFLSISVCKSNVKKDTYYGKVAFKGTVSVEELLYTLKEGAPYIDIQMVKIALEKLSNVIVDYAASGYIVNFFDLGSFSLKVKGALDVKKSGKELLSVFEKESFDSEGIVASFSGKHCDASLKDDASFKGTDEEDRKNAKRPVQVLPTVCAKLHNHKRQNAQANAISDRIAQYHRYHCYESRESLGHIL